MMKKINIIGCLFCAMFLLACNSWLDLKPYGEVEADKMFEDEQGFIQTLTGSYLLLTAPTAYGYELTAGFPDEIVHYWKKKSEFYRFDYKNMDVESRLKATWSQMYKAIANTNLVLDHLKEKNPDDLEYYNLIRDKDPTWREYEVTEQCQDAGIRATWEQIQRMAQCAGNFVIYMRHSTPHKMLKYIEGLKSEGPCAMRNQEVNDYHDYLQLAAGLGYNLDDDWILYPKNLKERHDQLTEEQNERKVELEKESDDKKDRKLKRTIKRKGWTRYEMETEELLIRLPECAHEIRKEGNAQHHCVATYMDRMVAGETCILFIRKKEEPDKSYYTVEVQDDEVIQVRGKYNAVPSEDVEEFMKIFKRNLRKTERKAS